MHKHYWQYLTPILVLALLGVGLHAMAGSPEDTRHATVKYFKKRFPQVKFNDYQNGIYALDKERLKHHRDEEDAFPAYLDALELGKKLFHSKFANGKSYRHCFKRKGIGIRQHFPYFDKKTGSIVTLEESINRCRTRNGEKAYPLGKGKLAAISAYMAQTSRGKTIKIKVPNDKRAVALYEQGKQAYFAKRGQLNFSCADCHIYNAGSMLRGNLLSPALGHVTHFPVWRKKWAHKSKDQNDSTRGLGTLHRRFKGCNKQVRAKPGKLQSREYKALEYFLTHMSNGQKVNGPRLRQ